ncbi:ras-related protein Rab-3B isoform X3 [Motacilla alba alba]|uniref:ras-related protein Rab-3B isoform X3 n=1 Tax=Motacilla alba alba TaxID=1094192 RepID=UPI0018D51A2F|nr:ras-related protein Rab-3B isoform X3 [Motacilla alba alba]
MWYLIFFLPCILGRRVGFPRCVLRAWLQPGSAAGVRGNISRWDRSGIATPAPAAPPFLLPEVQQCDHSLDSYTHSKAFISLMDYRSKLMASVTDARFRQKDTSDQNFDYMFKLLIIGNSSVGKTSFLFRYADDTFTPAFVSTVGIDFKVKTVYRNDKRVKLQIWVPVSHMPPKFSSSLQGYLG